MKAITGGGVIMCGGMVVLAPVMGSEWMAMPETDITEAMAMFC